MAKSKKKRKGKAPEPTKPWPKAGSPPEPKQATWTPWQKAQLSPVMLAKLDAQGARRADAVWLNNIYQVLVYKNIIKGDSWPQMHWLSIKRLDKGWIHDWREFQRIKNDLIGDEFEAVELYPAESRKVDTANQYHLFVLANTKQWFPFGYNQRLIAEPGEHETHAGRTSVQRPFALDDVPPDVKSAGEVRDMTDDAEQEHAEQDGDESPAQREKKTS